MISHWYPSTLPVLSVALHIGLPRVGLLLVNCYHHTLVLPPHSPSRMTLTPLVSLPQEMGVWQEGLRPSPRPVLVKRLGTSEFAKGR